MKQEEVERLRRRAVRKVKEAIATGQLPRITKDTQCVDCGSVAIEYEHRDYYQPLEVEPVCRKCNMRRGPAHPVAEDRYERSGVRWDGLNDGDGEEIEFTGRCIAEIDWNRIEIELEAARRQVDPDVVAADRELWKLGKKRNPYTFSRHVFIGSQLIQLRGERIWDRHKQKQIIEWTVFNKVTLRDRPQERAAA